MGQSRVHTVDVRPDITAGRPVQSLLMSLRPAWPRLAVAVVAYLVKDSPIWVLPVITSAVIDTVVAGGPPTALVLRGSGLCCSWG